MSNIGAPKCAKCGSEKQTRRHGEKNGRVRWVASCQPCARRRQASKRKQAGGAAALNKRWECKNKEKALAHKAVEHALSRGKMQKEPCERCGSTDVHAHHDDYSKQLEVMWLCPLHHKERHRELDKFTAKSSQAVDKAASLASHGDAATLQHGALV